MRELEGVDMAHVQVQRTARIVSFGTPSDAVRQIWICCHGYGQLAPKFAAQLGALQSPHRLVFVPEALNRFYVDDHGGQHGPEHPVGATWMTREERDSEIRDYCAYLDTVHDIAHARLTQQPTVIALGFSQGAATVSRWVARTTRPVDHVVLWGAGAAADLELKPQAFGSASLTLVGGTRDRNVSVAAFTRERQRLATAGLTPILEQFDGGHRMDDEILLVLANRFS